MTIKDLNPQIVWKYFHELTQIPRPSKKEEKVIAYLEEFAKKHKLEYKKDDAGNVVIYKQASKGKENLPIVILQGHVDMVCEKNSSTKHDFDNEPIETQVVDGWLKAKGTTLGADNGIGVAAALALLSSNEYEHGPLECLFTVDEETGLTGAHALSKDLLKGEILINLDTEEEGEIYIGCAGGKGTTAIIEYKPMSAPMNYFWFRVDVTGLNGGHSGADIHMGLGNANKIINRYLWQINKEIGILIASINGGNLHNAIAREAHAIAGVPSNKKEEIIIILNTLLPQIQEELKHVDPNLEMKVSSTDAPTHIIDNETSSKLLNALYACPHGVISMSADVHGLVETSTNLAAVKMVEGNKIEIKTSQRSSSESQKNNIINMVTATFELAGATVQHSDGYPGWQPNKDSKILKVAENVYKKMYNVEPEIKAIHAGLECGLFLEKYPHLDMISCGPTIREAHSPEEKVEIASVEKWWNYLLEVLKNIPSK